MKKKSYVDAVKEPLTVYWFAYREDLVQAFEFAGFDNLQKMGYKIWDDVDYDAENVEIQYEELLNSYKREWVKLPPAQQAQKLMDAFKLTDVELEVILTQKDFEFFN